MQRNHNHPTIVTIEKIIDETPTVRTLVFSDEVMSNVLPGQFAMVWIPGINELPMSVMISKESGKAAFTVRKHGPASTGLFNIKVGEQIGIRGPYGNSFDIKEGKLLLVGGGTGLVPMMRLLTFVKPTDDVTILIGAQSKDEVFFEDLANSLLENNPHRVIVSTDDGSYGEKGFVTDLVEKLVSETHFDAVYVCGPEIMMYKTVESAHSRGMFVQASLERMMKCGVGICGSCCVGEDLVCRDGTVFDGQHLSSNKEFGHFHRNKAGVLENY
ncbi:dihydroorotate dehydrogenase electron transfer subunit [Marine Group I thaumarchaeote]|uniref:Dihydroorotate dehydrogenase electron transfer subunit n=1 Tax=Marine Group I thaumarchaeote TaxID=2511932 RepID=A0A7K4M984_9ARCH|nr:MAG: dihydroorotate dehydrogenase electron transfer subunit [Nitrosopumilus sp. YT1]NMI82140.1 dihydroorotate dehydrogenase electron transfer subunit [Candidatus Nitrosopumilus sp. MTA1]NWJ20360.1 dihydroorotate dehydrogenase electron transfer subunit [Marine Group I thaumarchaeote]NWJ56168.1 dihydroorotate dehydrogenase electron transfer subunit [Marine Group I thaumarchaeote]NWJ83998.1 dihydroorotate dehydrogenase electron transfer subunit [Marine Group I thaumarchaeote]